MKKLSGFILLYVMVAFLFSSNASAYESYQYYQHNTYSNLNVKIDVAYKGSETTGTRQFVVKLFKITPWGEMPGENDIFINFDLSDPKPHPNAYRVKTVVDTFFQLDPGQYVIRVYADGGTDKWSHSIVAPY
ncbi:hypothetical protein [Paenibacillus taiwanensis]|uniref:hypothetical protein n=1 Tax=Paenibacillus taiwanensis TaxID=401638 RepID=UPI000404A238|nr:hypothetical protein [Paenibacillus taiwanensis]